MTRTTDAADAVGGRRPEPATGRGAGPMSALPDLDLTRGFAATRTSLQAALHALDAAHGKAADGRYGDAVLAIGATMLTRLEDADARVNDLVDRLEALGGLERLAG